MPRTLITHADRMPDHMHSTRLVRAPKHPAARREYLGSYQWTRRFERWITESVGGTSAQAELRLSPEQWWRNPYLLSRLPAHFPAALITALVDLAALQADFSRWERFTWDGDDSTFDQRQLDTNAEASQIATDARHALDLAATTHERALAWLTRQREGVLAFVYRTYYPRRRHAA